MGKIMKEHINELQRLTDQLPIIPRLDELIRLTGERFIEYEVYNGTCIGFGLLKKDDIAIQKTFLSKDTIFPSHAHKESIEYLIVYKGEIKANINNKEYNIFAGEHIRFDRGVEHSLTALKDTWLIGITIPKDEAYPDSKKD